VAVVPSASALRQSSRDARAGGARGRETLVLGPTRHLTKSKATDEEVVRTVGELIKAGRSGRRSGAMKGDFEKPAIHPLVFLGLPGRPGQSL